MPNGDVSGSIASSNDADKTTLTIRIARGPNGFGFTIENSSSGYQKVKKISDMKRCGDLRENDQLSHLDGGRVWDFGFLVTSVFPPGVNLRKMSHADVVSMLKSFQTGKEAVFQVLRPKPKRGFFSASSSPRSSRSSTKKKGSFFSLFASKKRNSEDSSKRSAVSSSPAPAADSERFEAENTVAPLSNRLQPALHERTNEPTSHFDRNQHAYSSFNRIITPAFIPASQYSASSGANNDQPYSDSNDTPRRQVPALQSRQDVDMFDQFNKDTAVGDETAEPFERFEEVRGVYDHPARSHQTQLTPVQVRRRSRGDEAEFAPVQNTDQRGNFVNSYDKPGER